MKNVSFAALFCLLFAGTLTAQTATEAPPVEEIADAYIQTIGGADAWKAIKATKLEGKVALQGMEFPITVFNAEGNKFRMDMDIQGSPMTQAYDGKSAWMLFPMQGITEPKVMSEDESADMKDNPFLDVFIDSEERGYTLEAVDGKEIEGTATYGVRVTNEEGFDRTYYFDSETMVPIVIATTSKGGPTKGMAMETILSDYEEVDGIVVPMFMEQKMNGQSAMKMTFTKLQIDPEIEDSMFSKPE